MMDKKELNAVELETIAGGDDWQVHNDNWFVERHDFQEPSPVVNPHPGFLRQMNILTLDTNYIP